MNISVLTAVLVSVAGIAFLGFIIFLIIKKSKNPARFDERQLYVRGQAYKYGFGAMITANAAYYFAQTLFIQRQIALDGVIPILSMFLGLAVFGVVCVLNDAFFTVGTKPGTYIAICLLCIVTNGYTAYRDIADGVIVQDGMLTYQVVPSGFTLVFILMLFAVIIRLVMARGETE